MLTLLWLISALWQTQAVAASLVLQGACEDASGTMPSWNEDDGGGTGAVHLLQRDAAHRVEQTRREGIRTAAQQPRGHSPELTKYFVDLDLPPKERFRKICRSLAEETLQQGADSSDEDALRSWINFWMSPEEQREWTELLRRSIPLEFLEELQGMEEEYETFIAEHDGAKLPFHTVDDLLFLSALYDINYPVSIGYPVPGDPVKPGKVELGCSGILAAQPNGTVLHGRNLDYVLYGSNGSSTSSSFYEVIYKRGGEPVFMSIVSGTLPSTGGTGMRFGGWSLSQNLHHANKRQLNLQNAKAGGLCAAWEMRRLLQVVPDFETALEELQQTRWMSPQYFVIAGAGPNEGAVVTAHRSKLDESSEAGYPKPLIFTRRLQPQAGTWYLVQTNDEAWALPDDDRRVTEQHWMEALGREGVNESSLMRLLRTPPALQFDTLFSWVAMSATNYSYLVQNQTYQ